MEGEIAGGIFALGIVFWLAGGASWVKQKTRQLKLNNDKLELENKAKAKSLGVELPAE